VRSSSPHAARNGSISSKIKRSAGISLSLTRSSRRNSPAAELAGREHARDPGLPVRPGVDEVAADVRVQRPDHA
jgi:hypothetical protein